MGKKQTKKRLGTCLFIVLLTLSIFGVLFQAPNILQTVHAQGATLINSFYPMSGASNPISGNPTDQHGFDVVHTTDIVQCNTIISGATWTYLAYDSNYEGSLINLYYSNSITGPWTAYFGNPILSGSGEFRTPSVVLVGGTFYMFLNNINDGDVELWTSTNGITFAKSGTILTTIYAPTTNPFVWLNPNDNLWYLFWEQGYDQKGWWEIMARDSSSITGLSTATDTVVMNVTTPFNTAFPTIMYTNGEYWLLTEGETSSSSGLWRVNAWYSTNPTSGYSLANNSPILTNDEACPQIFLTNNNACYLFTNQNQTSNLWYQEIRTVYIPTVSVSPTSWAMDVGQSTTFTATPSGGTGTYTSYQWYVGGVAQSGATSSTFSFAPASAGSYSITVTVTDSSGATSTQSTAATVTVNPTVTVSPTSWAMDVGQSTTFTATPSGGTGTYTSYQWYVNSVAQSGQTASTFNYSPASSGSYLITATVTDSLGVTSPQSTAATVTVNSAPTVSVSPSSWTMDVGQSKAFSATPSEGSGTYMSYQWYVDGAAQIGQTSSTFSYSPASSGSYSITVTVTDSSGATSAQSAAGTVTVNSALVAPTASASIGTVDQGQTSALSSTAVTTGTSPYTYQWLQKAPGASSYSAISGATSSSYSFATRGSTTTGSWSFELQVTDSASAPAVVASATVSVAVNVAPTATVSPASWTMDVGQSETFTCTASGGSGTLSYQWYLAGSAVSGQTGSTYAYSPSAAGTPTIYCKVTDSASSPYVVQSNTPTLTVHPAQTATVSPASWTMDVGQSKTFTATPVGGSGSYTGYQWYVGGVAQSGQTASTFSYSPASSGSYSITVTVTDSSGATSVQSSPAVVMVNAYPSVTIDAGQTLDVGQSHTFTAIVTGGTSPFSYQWYLNGNPVGTDSASYTYKAAASGEPSVNIYVEVTDSASTPVTVYSAASTVTVNALPTLTVSPGSWTMNIGRSEIFTANPIGGSGTYVSYQWYVDGIAQNGQASSTFSYYAGSLGSYSIIVTVTDSVSVTSALSSPAIVTVNDVAPSITAPSDITVDANTLGGVTGVILGTPSFSSIAYDSSQLTVTNNASVLFTLGSTNVTWAVTDPSGLYATATQVVTVNAGDATHFVVSAPSSATAGTAFSVTVKAYDAAGNLATGYSGTVHFASTSAGTLPADSTLSGGVGTFSVTLTSAGSQTITATDTANSSLTGTSGSILVSPASLDHITISPSSSIVAGGSQSYFVAAYDAYGNSLGDVTSATTFTAPGATVSGNTVSATNVGSYLVTAAYKSKIATAILMVSAAAIPNVSTLTVNTYSVTSTENGLPAGQSWNMTFNGITESSMTNTIVFNGVTAGTYSWTTQTPIINGTGTRYVASSASGTVNVPSETSVSISYTTQYYLTVNSTYGNVTGAGWYSAGAIANFSAKSSVAGDSGNQYIFNGWTGTGAGSYIGSGTTHSVTMNNPITETVNWTTAPSTNLYIIGISAIIIFAAALTTFWLNRRRRKQKRTGANSTPTSKA